MQLYHVVVVKPSHVPAAPAAAAAAGRNQSSIVGRRATATVAGRRDRCVYIMQSATPSRRMNQGHNSSNH